MATKQEILEYLRQTPENTNINVVETMLEGEDGGSLPRLDITQVDNDTVYIEGDSMESSTCYSIYEDDQFVMNGYFYTPDGEKYFLFLEDGEIIKITDEIETHLIGKFINETLDILSERIPVRLSLDSSVSSATIKMPLTDQYNEAVTLVTADSSSRAVNPHGYLPINWIGVEIIHNVSDDLKVMCSYDSGSVEVSLSNNIINFSNLFNYLRNMDSMPLVTIMFTTNIK